MTLLGCHAPIQPTFLKPLWVFLGSFFVPHLDVTPWNPWPFVTATVSTDSLSSNIDDTSTFFSSKPLAYLTLSATVPPLICTSMICALFAFHFLVVLFELMINLTTQQSLAIAAKSSSFFDSSFGFDHPLDPPFYLFLNSLDRTDDHTVLVLTNPVGDSLYPVIPSTFITGVSTTVTAWVHSFLCFFEPCFETSTTTCVIPAF